MASDTPVSAKENLLARLDRIPMTRRSWLIIGILIVAWLVESFDIGIVGTVVFSLQKTWQLSPSDVGLLGASGTAGIVIGLVPAGKLADLYGRRRLLAWGIAIFSAFTLLSGLAWNLPTLLGFRFLAGLGEGAVFPIPYMLISEFVNSRKRGASIGWAELVLTAGYTLPSLVGIWAVGSFTPDLAWRIPLAVGALPLLIIPPLLLWVPESPRYLLRRDEYAKVRGFVERLETEANLPHDDELANPGAMAGLRAEEAERAGAVRQVLSRPYLSRSLVAYAALLASFVLWYAMLTYAPTIFSTMGASRSNALLFSAVMMFIAGFGALAQGYLGDRFGRKVVHPAYMVLAAIGLVLLGHRLPIGVVVFGALLAAFFGLGSFTLPKLYVTEQYPTALRGAGSATGEMVTRFLAGVLFVYYIPALLAGLGPAWLFTIAGIAMVVLILPMVFFGQETANRSVEEKGLRVSGVSDAATIARERSRPA
jgi:MFS transporter, putative metabolite:H+ symporter